MAALPEDLRRDLADALVVLNVGQIDALLFEKVPDQFRQQAPGGETEIDRRSV